MSQFRYGEVAVGSVDLTPDSHPVDIEGRPQMSISMFGVLTEGVRHFTQYIPSPRSRIRAFEDVGACVAEILADGAQPARAGGVNGLRARVRRPVTRPAAASAWSRSSIRSSGCSSPTDRRTMSGVMPASFRSSG